MGSNRAELGACGIPVECMGKCALVGGELGADCAHCLLSSPILASRVVQEDAYFSAYDGPLSKNCCL